MSAAAMQEPREPQTDGLTGRRQLARDLSRLANASVSEALQMLRDETVSTSRRIGFTGPPGAGKSTLIGRIAKLRAARGEALAIVAIDPSSPKSSGALLGDRVRMDALLAGTDVYIRSLPSGRSADGLSDNLADVLGAVEAQGFAGILIETVGVGQIEAGARALVDTLVLAMGPQSGDQIQAMKAGVLETADIVVINKADLPGAERMAQDIRNVLERQRGDGRHVPPVLLTQASDAASIEGLSRAIDEHGAWRVAHVDAAQDAEERRLWHARSLLNRRVAELIDAMPAAMRVAGVAQIYRHVSRLMNEDALANQRDA